MRLRKMYTHTMADRVTDWLSRLHALIPSRMPPGGCNQITICCKCQENETLFYTYKIDFANFEKICRKTKILNPIHKKLFAEGIFNRKGWKWSLIAPSGRVRTGLSPGMCARPLRWQLGGERVRFVCVWVDVTRVTHSLKSGYNFDISRSTWPCCC